MSKQPLTSWLRHLVVMVLFSHVVLGATLAKAGQTPVSPPPMGWSSWNSFAGGINYGVIRGQVDALIAQNMVVAGYRYINIDEGWWHGARDTGGNIVVDSGQWPGGMAAIVDYIHSKGLKAGIYTDAGKSGCGYYYPTNAPAYANTGSEGHYQQDMQQFQSWGFDYVKVDWCGGQVEGLDPQSTYQALRAAIEAATRQTGRPLVLSLCDWGVNQPWNWANGVGAAWRTGTDLYYYGTQATIDAVLASFDQAQHPLAQHTGGYNDPDMLTVGMSGLSDQNSRLHMSLWAIAGAPLLAGLDLTAMNSTTRATLTNKGVIAIDQDSRGLPAVKVAEDSPGLQVYAKTLSGSGRRAVLLLNRTSSAAYISARLSDIALTNNTSTVSDPWSAQQIATTTNIYTTAVPANDAVLVTITGTDIATTTYTANNAKLYGSSTLGDCQACAGGKVVRYVGQGNANTLLMTGIVAKVTGISIMDIAYVNGDGAPRTAVMSVNGVQVPTIVTFPSTGSWSTPGTVSVLVSLANSTTNTVGFSNAVTWAPDIGSLSISPIAGSSGVLLTSGQSSRCLDIDNNAMANGSVAQIWDCNAGQNQVWSYSSAKQLVVYGSKCLGTQGGGAANGTQVVTWSCNGSRDQQWTLNPNGTIVNTSSGLCLDVSGQRTTNGTKLQLWSCNGQSNQSWSKL